MEEKKEWTVKEAIKLYFGETNLSEDESQKIDEALRSINENGFKEKCHELVSKKEKEIWRFGKLSVSKAACTVAIMCIIIILCGFTLIMKYIKEIKVNDMDDHSEISVTYDENSNYVVHSELTEYKTPTWIPDGYVVDSVFKDNMNYQIIYISSSSGLRINYTQYLASVNVHYSTEDGIHEDVSFGNYVGEYVETAKSNYLIVTDGKYLFSLIGDDVDKDTLIKMLK